MQYIGKLINQTWENSKKPNFGPDFGLIGPNLGPTFFVCGLYIYYILNSVANYHHIEFHIKTMIQTQENGKKPHFQPHLGWFGPNSCHQKLFIKLVVIVPSYHPTQFKGKLMNQTWENGEKPYFRANFGLFGPNLDHKFFCKHFSSTKF